MASGETMTIELQLALTLSSDSSTGAIRLALPMLFRDEAYQLSVKPDASVYAADARQPLVLHEYSNPVTVGPADYHDSSVRMGVQPGVDQQLDSLVSPFFDLRLRVACASQITGVTASLGDHIEVRYDLT